MRDCTLAEPSLENGTLSLAMSCLDADRQALVDVAIAVPAEALPRGVSAGDSVELTVEYVDWDLIHPFIEVRDAEGPLVGIVQYSHSAVSWEPVTLSFEQDPNCEFIEAVPGWGSVSVGGGEGVTIHLGESVLVGDEDHEWDLHLTHAEK